MHRITKLLIVLVIVLAAAVVLDKTVGLRGSGGPRELSAKDQAKLESLQEQFRRERSRFLRTRDSGAPADEVTAQEAKAGKVADEIIKLGGVEALQAVGRAPELQRGRGMGRGRGGAPGRGRRGPGGAPPGSARGGAPAHTRPAPSEAPGKP